MSEDSINEFHFRWLDIILSRYDFDDSPGVRGLYLDTDIMIALDHMFFLQWRTFSVKKWLKIQWEIEFEILNVEFGDLSEFLTEKVSQFRKKACDQDFKSFWGEKWNEMHILTPICEFKKIFRAIPSKSVWKISKSISRDYNGSRWT